MSNLNKYISLKLINRRDQTNNRSIRLKHLEKQKTISLSDEDLIEENEEEARHEEARLAEEALATNLKMIKKQKAKFIRLQKILSRNVILIPLCAIFSILSAVTIFCSSLTDYYEIITYDLNKLKRNIQFENNSTMLHIQQYLNDNNKTIDDFVINRLKRNDLSNETAVNRQKRDLETNKKLYDDSILGGILISHDDTAPHLNEQIVNQPDLDHLSSLPIQLKNAYIYDLVEFSDYSFLFRRHFFTNDTKYIKKSIIYTTHSGIWRQCNYLSDQSRKILNLEECSLYKAKNLTDTNYQLYYIDHENEIHIKDPARDLIRMHNAAACCIIVCYFLLLFSWGTGIAAVFTKKVPITLATGVLKLCICVFLVFLLGIVHRKLISEEKEHDCLDLKIELTIVCSTKQLKFGYSLGLAWIATLFTTLCCVCWFQITKMQKLLFTNGYY